MACLAGMTLKCQIHGLQIPKNLQFNLFYNAMLICVGETRKHIYAWPVCEANMHFKGLLDMFENELKMRPYGLENMFKNSREGLARET